MQNRARMSGQARKAAETRAGSGTCHLLQRLIGILVVIVSIAGCGESDRKQEARLGDTLTSPTGSDAKSHAKSEDKSAEKSAEKRAGKNAEKQLGFDRTWTSGDHAPPPAKPKPLARPAAVQSAALDDVRYADALPVTEGAAARDTGLSRVVGERWSAIATSQRRHIRRAAASADGQPAARRKSAGVFRASPGAAVRRTHSGGFRNPAGRAAAFGSEVRTYAFHAA